MKKDFNYYMQDSSTETVFTTFKWFNMLSGLLNEETALVSYFTVLIQGSFKISTFRTLEQPKDWWIIGFQDVIGKELHVPVWCNLSVAYQNLFMMKLDTRIILFQSNWQKYFIFQNLYKTLRIFSFMHEAVNHIYIGDIISLTSPPLSFDEKSTFIHETLAPELYKVTI